ncbi:MAG: hypothetical protein A2136_09315 [Chloroflexi bacterium RBG_16_54_11]|nr:MAG: hypothetical protein A2136_09315 [Chloroflexi bacterium RBG_16_54_11]
MRLSKPVKVIIGVFTAWELISPFLYFALWFFFMSSIFYSAETNTPPEDYIFPIFFLPFMFLIFCNSFLQLGLRFFYLSHIILNKTANDIIRVVLGISIFIFSPIAMPIYYFIFIWPEKPPTWALATNPVQAGTSPQGE